MVARCDQVFALDINDYDLSLSRYHSAVIGLPKINLLVTSPKDRWDYSPRHEARPLPLMHFCRPASRREPLPKNKKRPVVMIANDTSPASLRCQRCAQPMKLIRRTQRYGGLPDLCTFECAACGISHTEECKPTTWHAADMYRKQAKACRDLAKQARSEDRAFWLGLSDCWQKLAQVDDKRDG
jgi:hypothetical protein